MIHSWPWCIFWSPVVLKCTGRWPSNHACYGSSNHFLRSVDSEKWPGNKALKSKDATQSFKSATSRSPAFPSNFQSVRTPVLDAKFSSLRSITFLQFNCQYFLHFISIPQDMASSCLPAFSKSLDLLIQIIRKFILMDSWLSCNRC